jgi:hypothetical protein
MSGATPPRDQSATPKHGFGPEEPRDGPSGPRRVSLSRDCDDGRLSDSSGANPRFSVATRALGVAQSTGSRRIGREPGLRRPSCANRRLRVDILATARRGDGSDPASRTIRRPTRDADDRTWSPTTRRGPGAPMRREIRIGERGRLRIRTETARIHVRSRSDARNGPLVGGPGPAHPTRAWWERPRR